MQIDNLSWFPGHMTKTKRMISAEIKNMDAVCEIVDARIPMSSRNPDVDELTAGKPRLIVLNRADQADPAETRRWTRYFRAQGCAVLEANAKNGVGTEKFSAAVRELLRDKLAAAAARGQVGKVVRVMVLGVPNVGKSTFINKVAHRKTARAEDRPGVTRSKQWVPVDPTLELLDTPGAPLFQLVDRAALVELLQARTETPWYGQLMTVPQAIAYFLQVNHWPEHYRIRLG